MGDLGIPTGDNIATFRAGFVFFWVPFYFVINTKISLLPVLPRSRHRLSPRSCPTPNGTHAFFAPHQMEKPNDDIMDSSDESKSKSVSVVPRRKAEEPRRRRDEKNEALVLSKDLLLKFANVPLPKAAK
eukprot:428347-Rhodomonas_salina.1